MYALLHRPHDRQCLKFLCFFEFKLYNFLTKSLLEGVRARAGLFCGRKKKPSLPSASAGPRNRSSCGRGAAGCPPASSRACAASARTCPRAGRSTFVGANFVHHQIITVANLQNRHEVSISDSSFSAVAKRNLAAELRKAHYTAFFEHYNIVLMEFPNLECLQVFRSFANVRSF